MNSGLDIAVVGAGVTGLAVASLLAERGHRVVVYERFESPAPVGAGLLVQPTGLTALEQLGCRVEIESLGHRIDRIHGLTATGRTVFDVSYCALATDMHAVAVHRAALHGVLWRAFERSGARLECDASIENARRTSEGRVVPVDSNGRSRDAVDLLVDASGARSMLRSLVSKRRAREFRYGAVWASVDDCGVAPNTLAQRYVGARIMLGYLPIGRVRTGDPPLAALFWSLKAAGHAAWGASFERWQDEVAALWPAMAPVVGRLSGPDELSLATYAHFTAERVHRDNVVLIGDAAHSTSPQLGQGANQGLIDAVVLARAVERATEISAALRKYELARRAHVRFYQVASAALTPFFQSDSRVLAAVRDRLFNPMNSLPYLRREMVRTLAGLKVGVFTSRVPRALIDVEQ